MFDEGAAINEALRELCGDDYQGLGVEVSRILSEKRAAFEREPLNVSQVKVELQRVIASFEDAVRKTKARCTHRWADGEDAREPVPVSGESFCRTCGNIFD